MQAYASNYTGHAKVNRLIFIASKTAGTPLELEALRLAAEQLRKVRVPATALVCGTCALSQRARAFDLILYCLLTLRLVVLSF